MNGENTNTDMHGDFCITNVEIICFPGLQKFTIATYYSGGWDVFPCPLRDLHSAVPLSINTEI